MSEVPNQFDLQAKYAAELLDARARERERSAGRKSRRSRRIPRKREGRGTEERGQRRVEDGEKDPVLKNANEAEVKERAARVRNHKQISSSSFVHPTVTFVCSRLTCPRPTARTPPEQFPKVPVTPAPFNLPPRVLTLPHERLFFISTTSRFS